MTITNQEFRARVLDNSSTENTYRNKQNRVEQNLLMVKLYRFYNRYTLKKNLNCNNFDNAPDFLKGKTLKKSVTKQFKNLSLKLLKTIKSQTQGMLT